MSDNWHGLCSTFGGPEKIPHLTLYKYITREDVWGELANRRNLGLNAPAETPMGAEVVRRAKTDLFFFAKYFLHETNPETSGKPIEENKICEHVHGQLCDLFVRKNSDLSIADQEGPARASRRKERIILYPRGAFKSTIDVADAAQWVINFPDIRILFLTAADDLATGFVGEVKGHFVRREHEVTPMDMFFPAFCKSQKEIDKESKFEFTCPVWAEKHLKRKETTILASSIVSTLSGLHFEVIKADDVVSNRNSENEIQCRKVSKNFYLNLKMLRPFGYLDIVGTRYAEEDLYGDYLDKNVGDIEVIGKGDCWDATHNTSTGLKVLIGQAWRVKPDIQAKIIAAERDVEKEPLTKADYNLLFPEVMSYEWLRSEQSQDDKIFEGQMNQNPRPMSKVAFPRDMLLRATVQFSEMPHRGPISQTWDFAFSKKKNRDYSTCSTAIWDEKGCMYVIDLSRDRYNATSLAKAVVGAAVRWHPFVIGIEDASGSHLLDPAIRHEAMKTNDEHVINVCSHIDWIPPDNQVDAKKIRMAALHPWIYEGRLKFANYLPHLATLYDEFERCLSSARHDDIPDVLSQQPRFAPQMARVLEKQEMTTMSVFDRAYNLTFGPWLTESEMGADAFGNLGGGAPPPITIIESEPEPEVRSESYAPGLDNILGAGICG